MGFVSRPLYLFPQFFNDKATEHLFGSGIYPEDFNDDKIGRAENLLAIKKLKWITRVPLSIKAAQLYVRDIPESQFAETDIEGYKAVARESNYGGIKQRWIIIESTARKESDLKQYPLLKVLLTLATVSIASQIFKLNGIA